MTLTRAITDFTEALPAEKPKAAAMLLRKIMAALGEDGQVHCEAGKAIASWLESLQ